MKKIIIGLIIGGILTTAVTVGAYTIEVTGMMMTGQLKEVGRGRVIKVYDQDNGAVCYVYENSYVYQGAISCFKN